MVEDVNMLSEVQESILKRAEEMCASIGANALGSCLYSALATVGAAREHGVDLMFQAGSAMWVCNYDEPHPMSFGYEWSDDVDVFHAVATGILPEVHCWAVDMYTKEVIDPTVVNLPEASGALGIKWTRPRPSVVWGKPQGRYVANRNAIETMLKLLAIARA